MRYTYLTHFESWYEITSKTAGVFGGVLCRVRPGRRISTSFPSDFFSMSLTTTFAQTITLKHWFSALLCSWSYQIVTLSFATHIPLLEAIWNLDTRIQATSAGWDPWPCPNQALPLVLQKEPNKIILSWGALKETGPQKPYTATSTRESSSFKP